MGKDPLKGGVQRLLCDHSGRSGWAFRRALRCARGGVRPLQLARLEAGRVALAWVNLDAASRALEDARRARANGRGRRPGSRDVGRAARRQGLADQSYAQALAGLRALTRPRTLTLAEAAPCSRSRRGAQPT